MAHVSSRAHRGQRPVQREEEPQRENSPKDRGFWLLSLSNLAAVLGAKPSVASPLPTGPRLLRKRRGEGKIKTVPPAGDHVLKHGEGGPMGRLLHPKPRAEAWAAELTQFLPVQSTKLPFHSQAQGEAGPRTLLLPERTRNSWPDGSVPSAHGPSLLPTGLISVGLGWAVLGREESGAYTGDKL